MIEVKKFVVGLLETNCYVVYSDDSKIGFLIDPGIFDRRIADEIEKNNICIKGIINTHGHIDHIAGNKEFGYPILAHENDREFFKNPAKNLALFTGIISLSPMPSRYLKDGDVVKESDMELIVIHTPGHTPGSISLKIGDRIFTGDTLFREGVGRTDFPYANEKDLFSSIKNRLMVFHDNVEILPGHGEESTIGHERKNNPFL